VPESFALGTGTCGNTSAGYATWSQCVVKVEKLCGRFGVGKFLWSLTWDGSNRKGLAINLLNPL